MSCASWTADVVGVVAVGSASVEHMASAKSAATVATRELSIISRFGCVDVGFRTVRVGSRGVRSN